MLYSLYWENIREDSFWSALHTCLIELRLVKYEINRYPAKINFKTNETSKIRKNILQK